MTWGGGVSGGGGGVATPEQITYQLDSLTFPLDPEAGDWVFVTTTGDDTGVVLEEWQFGGTDWTAIRFADRPAYLCTDGELGQIKNGDFTDSTAPTTIADWTYTAGNTVQVVTTGTQGTMVLPAMSLDTVNPNPLSASIAEAHPTAPIGKYYGAGYQQAISFDYRQRDSYAKTFFQAQLWAGPTFATAVLAGWDDYLESTNPTVISRVTTITTNGDGVAGDNLWLSFYNDNQSQPLDGSTPNTTINGRAVLIDNVAVGALIDIEGTKGIYAYDPATDLYYSQKTDLVYTREELANGGAVICDIGAQLDYTPVQLAVGDPLPASANPGQLAVVTQTGVATEDAIETYVWTASGWQIQYQNFISEYATFKLTADGSSSTGEVVGDGGLWALDALQSSSGAITATVDGLTGFSDGVVYEATFIGNYDANADNATRLVFEYAGVDRTTESIARTQNRNTSAGTLQTAKVRFDGAAGAALKIKSISGGGFFTQEGTYLSVKAISRFVTSQQETDWISAGPLGITATTTDPAKATVTEQDVMLYRLKGNNWIEVEMIYTAASAAGATTGSGEYIFALPSDYPIDTAYPRQEIFSGTVSSPWTASGTTVPNSTLRTIEGFVKQSSANATIAPLPYTANSVRMVTRAGTSGNNVIRGTHYQLAVNGKAMYARFEYKYA